MPDLDLLLSLEDFRALLIEQGTCPLQNQMYGGLPSSGGFSSATEYEIGAQRFLEAAHCILGSLHKASADYKQRLGIETDHIKEELGIMNKVMKEYSKYLYVDRVWTDSDYKDKSVSSIRKAGPLLAEKARNLEKQVDYSSMPEVVKPVVKSLYLVVATLAQLMVKSVKDYPEEPAPSPNAFNTSLLERMMNEVNESTQTLLKAIKEGTV